MAEPAFAPALETEGRTVRAGAGLTNQRGVTRLLRGEVQEQARSPVTEVNRAGRREDFVPYRRVVRRVRVDYRRSHGRYAGVRRCFAATSRATIGASRRVRLFGGARRHEPHGGEGSPEGSMPRPPCLETRRNDLDHVRNFGLLAAAVCASRQEPMVLKVSRSGPKFASGQGLDYLYRPVVTLLRS